MVKKIQRKEVLRDVFTFLIRFNLLLIPFYAIIYFDVDFYPLQVVFARLMASFLKLMNYPVFTRGFFLFVGEEEHPIDISRDCIGWKSAYSLFALVFATRGQTKNKLKFLLVWIPVLLLINVFRVLVTLLIGLNFGFRYLEIVHTFLWQGATIAILLMVWYVWLKKRSLIGKKVK